MSEWKELECEVRCNNCMTYFINDSHMDIVYDEEFKENVTGCVECGTDDYLMEKPI